MPQFIPVVVAVASSAASLYSSSALFAFAVNTAFTIGTSALIQSLNKPPSPADRTATLSGGIAPRKVHFGQTLAPGTFLYDDSANGTRWQVIGHNHGPVHRVLSTRFDNTVRSKRSDNRVLPDSLFGDAVYHELIPGTENQAASPLMLNPAPYSGNPTAPGWTADHRLRGIMASVVRSKTTTPENFGRVYPTGRPPIAIPEVQAGFPFDPRSNTTGYKDNGALLLAWFLTHPLGLRLPSERINWDSIAAAADVYDQLGWSIAGAWSANDAPKVGLANMLGALDAAMWVGGDGRVNITPGIFTAPTQQITLDHILSISSLAAGAPEGKGVSEVVVSYPNRANDFAIEEVSSGELADVPYAPNNIEFLYIPHEVQAQARAKRELAIASPDWRLDATLNLAGLALINQRFFELHLPDYGVVNEVMELESWSFNTETGQVSISARSVSESDFPSI